MYPRYDVKFKNEAEEFVYYYLKENLPSKFICYYSYFAEEREMDFCILVPEYGFIVLEVKNWDGNDIVSIVDNTTINYINSKKELKSDKSPLKQCRNYCFKLSEVIKDRTDLNIFIAPIVCYPNMTEKLYTEKSLENISSRNITLLNEDFEQCNKFVDILLKKSLHVSRKHKDKINEANSIAIRLLFETEEEINSLLPNGTKLCEPTKYRDHYSKLLFLPRTLTSEEVLDRLEHTLTQWKKGIKIIILTEIKGVSEKIHHIINCESINQYNYLSNYEAFSIYDEKQKQFSNRMFNLEVYEGLYTSIIEEFEIIDGCTEENVQRVLECFNVKTDFNLGQYRIEHSDYDKNILVTAGAGTGKTYSMISRISYLIYKNALIPEEIVSAIFMITFTNEAADNMKRRLKEYFSNMFVLTENTDYLSIMELVSKMNISTIHSLVKKIIQHYAVLLGVGNSISIESSIYNRREAIIKYLDKLVRSNEKYLDVVSQYEKYEVVKAVESLLDKFEKKNIDLSNHYNFGTVMGQSKDRLLFELVKNIAQGVQVNTIEEDIDNNKVQLSNLMIYLLKVLNILEDRSSIESSIKYLFVDEFQDTDDMQIDLIKRFHKLFKFKLFVVGDIKQCIYRFRGAEDNAFDLLLEGTSNWEKHSLNKNYRSFDELLQEFHIHFKMFGKLDLLKYDKNSILTGIKHSNIGQSLARCCDYNDESEFEQLLVKTIYSLKNNLKEKESIAILTRTNEEIEKVREICKSNEIDIDTEMVDNLYQLESTMDLYKLILALQFNTNPKYLYNLSLTNYSRRISSRVVYKHRNDPSYITNLFMENKIIPGWSSYIEKLKNEPVIRIIKEIIYDIKPWNHYANSKNIIDENERLKNKIHYKRNLDLLIENIIKRSNDEYITINMLRDFLYIMIFAKQHEDERANKEEAKDLICTTVHKSKGLEYTHVIVPFCNFELESIKGNELIVKGKDIGIQLKIGESLIHNDIFSNEKDHEKRSKVQEETRILYVAMTRAEKTFTWLKGLNSESQKVKESWQKLLERK